MQYMRCKCGKRECWTSMGHSSCDVCEDCGSTLGYGPSSHPERSEHEVYAEIKGDKVVARCHRCFKERPTREAVNLPEIREQIKTLKSLQWDEDLFPI